MEKSVPCTACKVAGRAGATTRHPAYRTGTDRAVLPARLADAGDQAVQGHVAERNAAEAEVTEKRARTAAHVAAVAHAGGRGIARQLMQRVHVTRTCRFFKRVCTSARKAGIAFTTSKAMFSS